MGLIQDLVRKWRDRKEEKEGYERGRRIEEGFEMKRLSANERELMKWQDQEREATIKRALDKIRKRENDEIWSGRKNNPISAPNIINNQKQIFRGEQNLFVKKTNLFNQPDLFFKK